MDSQTLLAVIAVLLLLILWKVNDIADRLKERFPTEKEQNYKWAKEDPAGHYEAHKKESSKDRK